MPLATRPKPKAYHKKRQAQHHRQSKHYLKAYFPYLPLVGIVTLGVLINRSWSPTSLGGATALATSPGLITTRLAVITGSQSSTLLYIVLGVTFAAFAGLVISHWYRLHRLVNRGEAFIIKHPWLDVALTLVVTTGVILTRATNVLS